MGPKRSFLKTKVLGKRKKERQREFVQKERKRGNQKGGRGIQPLRDFAGGGARSEKNRK